MFEKLPDVIGHALSDVRAGLDQIVFNTLGLRAGMATIEVRSLAFADHAPIPERYTADGEGVSPPLSWTSLPEGTRSAVLMVEDADSPTPNPLVHAIAVGLADDGAGGGVLAEGAIAQDEAAHDKGDDDSQEADPAPHIGRNSTLQAGWLPPDPPPGHGVHRYAFQIYALAAGAEFSDAPGRDEVVEQLRAHAIASGLLIGTYERPDTSIKIGEAGAVAAPLAGA